MSNPKNFQGSLFRFMENQGFEGEQYRNNGSSYFIHTDSAIHPDVHVYEDIGPSREEFCRISSGFLEESARSKVEQNGRSFITSNFKNDATERIRSESSQSIYFQRNLTLPFRRGLLSSTSSPSTSYSIWEKRWKSSKEKKDRSLERNLSDNPRSREDNGNKNNALSRLREEDHVRASEKCRRKDYKYCKNKGNSVNSESQEKINANDEKGKESSCSCLSNETILFQHSDKFLPLCHSLCKTTEESTEFTRQNSSSIAIFSISEKVQQQKQEQYHHRHHHEQQHLPSRALEYLQYDRNDVETKLAHVLETNEDKTLIISKRSQPNMRINSIYTQDHWYAKEASIFFTDLKESSTFQRAYSLPVRMQTPTSQNRVNLRKSVRGEPPPDPARLHKNHRGWTLHLARPLEGSGCNRSLIFLLVLLLILLGVGAGALYIVFEPQKLQIIQLYLKSSNGNSSMQNVTSEESFNQVFLNESKNVPMRTPTTSTIHMTDVFLNVDLSFSDDTPSLITKTETEASNIVHANTNSTRYCDDCLSGEVCVGLVDEEVPICRIGLDPEDPTGCAGLCIINKQRCHRLDIDAFRCVEIEHYCLNDEWTCVNTLCIPMEKRCDGHMNCYDHSDEYNCDCNSETHFQCGNDTSCLPLERRCDGRIDCWDASDEINCTLACPLESEFTCSNGQCILRARFCDGLVDCADGSDEPHGCEGRCNKHEFTCQNNRCIAKGAKCNGIDDCGDYSDERHCKDHVM
ncbi:uncharacterized protein LOC118448751 isoform X2 [Vespa mandarinia]|uniref:uncharacterized protein LOC118448751 isoform X2 n=1 Tax=Vespa mandarinia TaxID=7446 RepID=UPI001609F7DA|nr:uncharacterized protein LOC118448751 isoform X2 [Vespa mandarinia]